LGLTAYTKFSDITSNTNLATALQTTYGDINKVELWVGGLAEDRYLGAMVGPTFHKIILDQFVKIRDGDNLYWENQPWPIEERNWIQGATLADVILRNTDTINLQIFQKTKPIYDTRCNKIGKSLYNSNLYQIVLLEFMTFFNNQRNTTIRQKIKKKMAINANKDFDELMKEINEIISNCDDYIKIKNQIYEFINNHRDKNILFADIDDSTPAPGPYPQGISAR
jgi:hypothetical protein